MARQGIFNVLMYVLSVFFLKSTGSKHIGALGPHNFELQSAEGRCTPRWPQL